LLELNGAGEGHSGRRVNAIWREVRGALEEKCRSYSLDKFAAKSEDEMYYI